MKISRWVWGCAMVFLLAGVASAQDEAPKAEVFAGYSYVRVNPGFGAPGINFNGGSASISYNPTGWLGLVGDFGGYHGSAFGIGADVYSYLFGPKLALRRGAFTPYVQTLFGGAHGSAGFDCTPSARVHREGVLIPCGSGSENAFAMTVGGGVDWNATEHIGIRVIQAEYLMTRFLSNTQNNARISTGVIFRW